MRMFGEVLGGQENFAPILGQYFNRFAYSNADSYDFASQIAGGNTRLQECFLDWIRQASHFEVDASAGRDEETSFREAFQN